uniref:H(+) cl(-) exchange transporter 7 n=1 Tax=Tetraselmis sp. GSL018 TaxID=582737 RepID=A0A061R9Q3_9CHLO
MAGAVYGHHKGGRFVVTRPHLPLEVDKASRNGRHFCRSGPGQAPQYNPAALLMTTPLGSDVANALFTQGIPQLFPARVLAIYLVVYFSLAVLTSGAAIPGGLIVPFVVMGGVIGRLAALFFTFLLDSSSIHSSSTPSWLAAAWEPLMSYIQSDFYVSPIEHRGFSVIPTMPDPGAYAIVGAAAFMAATGRLSLFFTVIMLEATGYISFVLPISIGAIVATLTGNFFNEGLYHILMEVAKMPYLPTMASIDQEAMRVKELFAGLKCHIISPVGDIHRWKELLDGVQHNGFPVVDSEGRLKGVILREALAAAIDEQLGRLRSGEVDKHIAWHLVYRRVQREMDAAPVTVRDRDPADQALLMFSRMRLRHMVVLSGERPVFLLTRHDLHPHAVTHSMFLTKSGKGVSNGHGNSINRSDRGAGRGGFPFSGLFPGTVAEGAEESPEKEPDPPSDGANRSEGGAEPRVDLEEAAAATAGGGDVETMQQNGSSGEGRKESRFGVWDILRPLRI